MRILYFYITKKFLKIFAAASIVFGVVVLISEVFRQISFYIEYEATAGLIAAHLITKLPWWIIQVLPIATLLSLLFSLGDLSSKNEITAIKAAGINLWNIIIMFLVLGFAIGMADLGAREFIVPKTTYLNEIIQFEKIEKKQLAIITEFENVVVSLENNVRLTAQHLSVDNNIMTDIVLEYYDDDFHIQKLVIAEKAVWRDGSWILENGIERDFYDNIWSEKVFNEYDTSIHLAPQDLAIRDVHYESMTTAEFKKYINQLRLFGYDASKARIVLNTRYAMIFCHVIVMMIGIPFALGMNNNFGKIISFTLALAMTFAYWGIQAITQSMGQNNLLSPFLSAWVPNFIFLSIGVYMLKNVRK
ncbi:MAG: LptF/LptG family permease [Elusimicrobiota bacterium]|nr:LptF/LptG family permease [Elusimicrobiota bacterium]